jgi:hypothetical protein
MRINACFLRIGEDAKSNLHADAGKIRTYLGTYFPRSFCESRNLHSLLLNLEQIRRTWSLKNRLNVLDFGSGTGGNLCGLIQSLASLGLHPDVHIHSIDGNMDALCYQEALMEHMQRNTGIRIHLHCIHRVFPNDPDGFSRDLRESFTSIPGGFDLIMAWKSLSELFIADSTSVCGCYDRFLEVCTPMLNDDGLVTVLDVTMKSRGQWLPTVMTRDLHRFMRNQDDFALIAPFGCAQRNGHCSPGGCYPKFTFPVRHRRCPSDRTKFTFFALGRKELASAILGSIPDGAPCPEECGRNGENCTTSPLQVREE